MNASWIARCFPEVAAGSCKEADGCCHATEHSSAPVILQERLIAWCYSFFLMVWAVSPACGPGMLSLLGGRAGSQGSRKSDPVWLCSREVIFDISTHECDSFLGRGFLVSPTGCLPFLPLLVPLKSVQFCSSFYGEMCRAWSILRKKAEGKIWDSSAWQSCSSATQKWKQPLSPVGLTFVLPTLFWDSPGQGTGLGQS